MFTFFTTAQMVWHCAIWLCSPSHRFQPEHPTRWMVRRVQINTSMGHSTNSVVCPNHENCFDLGSLQHESESLNDFTTLSQFVGKTKLSRNTEWLEGRKALQKLLVRLHPWAKANCVRFKKAKCHGHVLHLGQHNLCRAKGIQGPEWLKNAH